MCNADTDMTHDEMQRDRRSDMGPGSEVCIGGGTDFKD